MGEGGPRRGSRRNRLWVTGLSVLLDTDFLVSYWNRDERRHAEATALFRELLEGDHGHLFVSDFVVDEAATLALRRLHDLGRVREFVRFLLGVQPSPKVLALLHVDDDLFQSAARRLLASSSRTLSFTDWTSVELVREFGIDSVATFDSGLRGLVSAIP